MIFVGGAGNGAKATAVINDNGQISEIIINEIGRGYEYPPDIILEEVLVDLELVKCLS